MSISSIIRLMVAMVKAPRIAAIQTIIVTTLMEVVLILVVKTLQILLLLIIIT